MASVNASRRRLAQNVNNATDDAKIIAFNDDGEACVWFGGYSFSVYDAANDWREVRHFTSGQIAGLAEKDSKEGRGYARARMRSEGFDPIE